MPGVVLAMEVSQRTGGLALRLPTGEILVDRMTRTTRLGDDLMACIAGLFRRGALDPSDLSGLGVSIGPGGFTGLRIGLAAAKVLGWSLGTPLVAVPTALVAAMTDSGVWSRGAVALAGKDDSCWLSIVEGPPGDRRLASGSDGGQLVYPEQFAKIVEGVEVVLADEFLPSSMIHSRMVRPLHFDPRALLALTDRKLAEAQTVDPFDLAPLYPREPEAVRLWDARDPKS